MLRLYRENNRENMGQKLTKSKVSFANLRGQHARKRRKIVIANAVNDSSPIVQCQATGEQHVLNLIHCRALPIQATQYERVGRWPSSERLTGKQKAHRV